MPSEHSRSSSGSSVTSPIPTINITPSTNPNGNSHNTSLSNSSSSSGSRNSHPDLLEISHARTGQNQRDRSTSRDRNSFRDKSTSRGKSPSRNKNSSSEKRGKSPGGRSKSPSGEKLLDRPKSQERSRSRSPGPKSPRSSNGSNKESSSRSKRISSDNSRSSSQDARVSLSSNLHPWISPFGNVGSGNTKNSSNRLSLPPDLDLSVLKETNERTWARLNLGSADKDTKNNMGSFSKLSSLRVPLLRPNSSVETFNKPMQRTPSGQGQRSGSSSASPFLAPGFPLMRSRSHNSAMDDVHRVQSPLFLDKPHPLQHSWTMYYDSKPVTTPGPKSPTGKLSYEENLQTIGTFNTVQTFCQYFNWVKKPSQLDLNTNFHIFKDNIKPMWEDPANENGGKWVISMRNPQLLDRCWSYLVYALVGEELDENDDICGAVMSRRIRGDRIAVWVRDKDNVSVINGIGRRLLKILDLQNEKGIGMDFQFNEDALKSGTSYNNRVYLSLESLKQELETAEKERKELEAKAKLSVDVQVKVTEPENPDITVTTPEIVTVDVDAIVNVTENGTQNLSHDSHSEEECGESHEIDEA